MKKILLLVFIIILAGVSFFIARSFRIPKLENVTAQQVIKLYNPNGNTIVGNPKGTVTMVEFFDYNCHFCRKYYPILQKVIKANPNLRVIYKEFLLFGDKSKLPSYAALAAARQGKYLAMHDAMLTATKPLTKTEIIRLAKLQHLNLRKLLIDMQSPIIKRQIAENTALMKSLNLWMAPIAIFVNSDILKHPDQVSQYKQYVRLGRFKNTAILNRLIAKCEN